MTIDEAIRILTEDKTCDFEGDALDLEDALQLGIEALKRYQDYQSFGDTQSGLLLPGETEEK